MDEGRPPPQGSIVVGGFNDLPDKRVRFLVTCDGMPRQDRQIINGTVVDIPLRLQGCWPMIDRRTFTMGASPCPTASMRQHVRRRVLMPADIRRWSNTPLPRPARARLRTSRWREWMGVVRPIYPNQRPPFAKLTMFVEAASAATNDSLPVEAFVAGRPPR